jgi:hypothetical protein
MHFTGHTSAQMPQPLQKLKSVSFLLPSFDGMQSSGQSTTQIMQLMHLFLSHTGLNDFHGPVLKLSEEAASVKPPISISFHVFPILLITLN